MRFSEIVRESRSAPLYHGTSLTHLISIIRSNKLDDGGMGVSLTRSKAFGVRIAEGRSLDFWIHDWEGECHSSDKRGLVRIDPRAYMEMASGSKGAVIVLDQLKLAQRYKVKPYDDFNYAGSGDLWRSEAEERVNRSIHPLMPYVTGVIIPDPASIVEYTRLCVEGDPEAGLTPQPELAHVLATIKDLLVTK